MNSPTTRSRKSSSRSSVRCGIPIRWARDRAPRTASGEQQLFAPSLCWSAHSFSVTATTPAPRSRSRRAATAESTPPLIATRTRSPSDGGSASTAREDAAAESARWSASAARSAAWRPCGERPPSAAAMSSAPISAASSTASSSAASAMAAAAPSAAAQPSASKVTSAMRPPSTTMETRTRSPQGAPPAAPVKAPSGAGARRESSPAYWASRAASISSPRLARPRRPIRNFKRLVLWGRYDVPKPPNAVSEGLLRVVRQVRRPLVERVADRLGDAVDAAEAVADGGLWQAAVGEVARSQHYQRRDPVDVDARGDARVARDVARVGDEQRDLGGARHRLRARLDRVIVDPVPPDHEQDHNLVLVVGLYDRRRQTRAGDEPARGRDGARRSCRGRGRRRIWCGGGRAGGGRGGRMSGGAGRRDRRRGVARGRRGRALRALVGHPGDQQEPDQQRERQEGADLDDRIVVERLSHGRPHPVAGNGRKKGPNLPVPLGLRTLLRRW